MSAPVFATQVRYIKLGRHGGWEKECLDNGTMRLGFGTDSPTRFRLAQSGNWEKLKKSFRDEGDTPGKASEFTNEVRHFFQDDGNTLWITFHGDLMYWAFLDSRGAKPHPDGVGVWRRVANGWKANDVNGAPLKKGRLSRGVTKLAGYPGTICLVHARDYVIRRINGGVRTRDASALLRLTFIPEEVEDEPAYPEGAVSRISVNAYERSAKARQRCIDLHGTTCCICGFDFGKVYGPVAEGLVHVHHVRDLSQCGGRYVVDPKKDLRPVCPNCHAVLHRRTPAYSIEDVKQFLQVRKGAQDD